MTAAMIGTARQIASGASGLAELLRRTVVEVRGNDSSVGAGIIWGGSGLVITNAHCVSRGAALEIDQAGRRHDARLLAFDTRHDLALLSAKSVNGPLLELREPQSLRVGELVFAHGHPLGMRDALAMGVIQGVTHGRRSNEPRYVIAAVRLAPGNSGGPLVDAECRLIGVNTMVVNGLGVAVPASLVRQFVERALASRAA